MRLSGSSIFKSSKSVDTSVHQFLLPIIVFSKLKWKASSVAHYSISSGLGSQPKSTLNVAEMEFSCLSHALTLDHISEPYSIICKIWVSKTLKASLGDNLPNTAPLYFLAW